MTCILRQARKRRFQLREEQRVAQDIELQTYLNQLIIEDAERRLVALREREGTMVASTTTAASAPNTTTTSTTNEADDNDSKEQVEGSSKSTREPGEALLDREEDIDEKKETCIARLNDLFAKVDDRRRVSWILLEL